MKCELRIVGGARAGHKDIHDKSYIGIGRHPMSDVRFDAEKDLDASTRHAAIVKTGESFVLRDLGSTNGTYVNGEKLTADRPLTDGDLLRFGVHGPEVSFHLVRESTDAAEVIMPAVTAPPKKVNPTAPEGIAAVKKPGARTPLEVNVDARTEDLPALPKRTAAPPPSKTSVLRAEISHQQSRFRMLAVTLFVLIIGALGVVYWQGKVTREDIATVTNRADSLSRELASLQALKTRNDAERDSLQNALRTERDPVRRTQLTTRIATVEARGAAIAQSQTVDYNAIRAANEPAIAQIYVRFASDTTKAFAGTAFVVSAEGLMLTNRHTVMGEGGEAPRDIAVQFSGSEQVHPARLVRMSPTNDLATIMIESQGPFPVVSGFADAAAAEGDPIVLLGFPGGGRRATLVTGSVSAVIPDSSLELDAFSGVGASGSPILDRNGKVLGVMYGGRVGSGGRAIMGLPIARGLALVR